MRKRRASDKLDKILADIVGSVAGRRTNSSRRTGKAFARLLKKKRKRRA